LGRRRRDSPVLRHVSLSLRRDRTRQNKYEAHRLVGGVFRIRALWWTSTKNPLQASSASDPPEAMKQLVEVNSPWSCLRLLA
jgi:hypothetical protein